MTVAIAGVEIKSVEHGGRQVTAQVVQCGYCPEEEPILHASGRAFPVEFVRKKASERGWRWANNGKHVCPKCLAKFRAAATRNAKVKDNNAPREMTPADKRRIFREIDANYDDARSRYIGEATDNSLAKTLGVPRKWVSDVREENFGPTGKNEEIDKIAGAIGNLAGNCDRVAKDAIEIAARAEQLRAEADALLKRIMAVEEAVGPRVVKSAS